MFKIVMAGVIFVLIYFFVPRYDLYEKRSSFSDEYMLNKKGFWSKEDCGVAGKRLKVPYQCRTTTAWRDMMGQQERYNEEREIE